MRQHLNSLSPARRRGGYTLIVLGVTVLLIEVILSNWIRENGVSWGVVGVGATIAYAGFAMLNGRKAKEQGQFVVDSVVRIVGTVRSGRKTQVLTTISAPDSAPDIEEPPPEKPS